MASYTPLSENKAIVGMAALQAMVSFLPSFRRILGTAPMGVIDLAVIAGSVLGPLVVNEAMKPAMPDAITLDEDDWEETVTDNDEDNQADEPT